ncbi:DUF1983 domain-containing protein [Escherichia coli]|nr:DUF1983 domain-containing protein [Escherichia coli]EFL4445458.1 DUF1983 domain-containing protein [Escherichia coli]
MLGTEVKYDTPITRTITSANIDRLRFTFGVQALVETTSKGDRNPSEVRLLVQIQRNGGWVTEKDITIKGKTTSQYLASVVVGNLPPRPFSIRMRRMTPDSTTDQLQNKTLWSSYTEIIDVKQCYPNQSGTVNGVTPPAVQHLTAEVTADSGEYQVLARWDTPKVVKGVSFLLRLTVAADDGSERLVSTARTTETTYRFTQLALGNYRLTVRAVNAWGQQGDPASVSFRIAAPAAPSRIELTPGYFQITATPHLAVYDPTVQFEFWFSEKRIADIRQVETTARYLGTALYWIAASINIRPGHNYYFYVRSVNTVGKSAFVEAVGQPSDDASGYLDFFKGEIGKTHLAQELWTQIDNGQLAPDLAEIRTSITDVSNEITQTVNKKLEDQSAAIQQIQKVQVDTNNNLNSMWAVKLQQMQDGRLYIAGIGAGIENTPDGMQSQVLLAADRIAMINPANGNIKPMFVGQGDQIFMNEVFLKRLTAPTITSGGNPPVMAFRMSEQPRTIKIYNLLAGTNEFIGEGDAYIPPHTGLPANSTDIAPPDIPAGFVAVFNSDEASWHLVEDHRGKTVYDVASGDALFISELGSLPENVTWLSPEGEYQKWNGTAWVKDTEAEKLFRIREAEETKNSLMQVASEHIAPLQDAVDLEIATEEETSLLEAWKKYRVLLNRVNTTTAPDIEWPTVPIIE